MKQILVKKKFRSKMLYYCAFIILLFCYTAFSNGNEDTFLSSRPKVDEALRLETLLPVRMVKDIGDKDTQKRDYVSLSNDFLRFQETISPFKGFYLRMHDFKDLEDYNYSYDIRLQWSAFREGYHESKRSHEKKKLQNELQVLQLENNVNEHSLNDSLDDIGTMSDYISFLNSSEMLAELENILKKRESQLKEGFITKDDLEHIRFRYNKAKLNKQLYGDEPLVFIDNLHYNILNRIEFGKLIEFKELIKHGEDTSVDLMIQKNLIKRSEFARSWTDDLTMDLFLQHRRDVNMDTENNVGVQFEIPLHYYRGRKKLIRKEKELYRRQMSAIKVRIEKKMKKFSNMFYFQQNRLLSKLLEYEKVSEILSYEKERMESAIEALNYTPERSIDLLVTEKVGIKYEIMDIRLKVYEVLMKIYFLSGLEHFTDVVVFR